MELAKELEDTINGIKTIHSIDGLNPKTAVIMVLKKLSGLCENAGENQWTIKDQIELAIQELKL